MCVELDLTRAVENCKRFFVAGAEGFIEPVEVFEEKPVVGRERGIRIRSYQGPTQEVDGEHTRSRPSIHRWGRAPFLP